MKGGDNIKIAIIGTVGLPAKYGGFETLAENLVRYQKDEFIYTVFCTKSEYSKRPNKFLKANLNYINLKANGIFSILYDFISMLKSLNNNVLLVLGVSGSIFLPIIKLIYNGKVITNIDGLEWKRNKWGYFQKKFLKISEKFAVKYSDIIIGDNKVIVDYVETEYGKTAFLIEYGSDHVKKSLNLELKYPFISTKYAITVCRIEPENNIDKILEAFKNCNFNMVIIGNWNTSKYSNNLYTKYKKYPNIYLLNPIYDIDVISFLRSKASIYVHGHSAGGTNPSLVEAMFLGLGIFAYDCSYNKETTEGACKYWSNSSQLKNLIQAYCLEDLNKIGQKMHDIAEHRYKWSTITAKYEKLFKTVLNKEKI